MTVAAPATKRLALSLVSLSMASMKVTSDSLCARVLGGWTSTLMFRRQFMSVLFHSHKLVDQSKIQSANPKVVGFPREVAEELVLLSVLCPLFAADISAPIQNKLFATDSSDAKGAVSETVVADDLARLFWRSGSKKGGYAALMKPLEALADKLEVAEEKTSLGGFAAMPGPQKPIGLRFNFIEVCGGAAKVSAEVSKRGWVVGPCIDLDRSERYNLASIEVLSYTVGLLEQSRMSKMAWLPEWIFLRENGWAVEDWLASCMYGSPHRKEFRLLATHIDLER